MKAASPGSDKQPSRAVAIKLLTINEGAEALKLSRWTVSAMLESGALPGIVLKTGRRKKIWRIRESDLERWIIAREQETKNLIHSTQRPLVPAVNLAVVNGAQEDHA